jgi:plastocyanin
MKRSAAVIVLPLALAFAACGSGGSVDSAGSAASGSTAGSAGPATITISNFTFGTMNQPVNVKAGDTVHFANMDNQPHTATSDTPGGFDAGSIAPMATVDVVIKAPGSYAYHCSFHPFMKATIVAS